MKKNINIICNQKYESIYNHPLFAFRKELKTLGYEFKYFNRLDDPEIFECNCLIFHDRYYGDLLPHNNIDRFAEIGFLSTFFSKFENVIWFDNMDGPGWIRDYVFPFVNKYVKGQLVKDLDFYFEKHLLGDPHRDYANENYGIQDKRNVREPLSKQDSKKLHIAWNMAFKNWYRTRNKNIQAIQKHLNISGYQLPYKTPNLQQRGSMIPYRVNYWTNIPSVQWWRTTTKQKIDDLINNNPQYYSNTQTRVNRFRYHQEMRNSKVTISPFGIGEICYRDFEAFINGSLLIKPSMEHLSTWPDFYNEDVTYVSHKWDFSDFNDKLENILTHPERYVEIAREGQKRFRNALLDGEGFAKHFSQIIESPI